VASRDGLPRPACEVEEGLPDVAVDADQLVECLVALADNALDAAGDAEGMRVRVRSSHGPGGEPVVIFEVTDDGAGIPEALLARVFDPFFTTKPKGIGLGLALTQTLVRENGGRLEVRSRPGETVFRIVLPAVVA
jgi:signal transduction histidine kinase